MEANRYKNTSGLKRTTSRSQLVCTQPRAQKPPEQSCETPPITDKAALEAALKAIKNKTEDSSYGGKPEDLSRVWLNTLLERGKTSPDKADNVFRATASLRL